jgi:hypothetical protein
MEESSRDYPNWYLSYDTTGKRKEAFLSKKLGPGCYWDLSKTFQMDTMPYDYVLLARNGKLKGYRLGAGEEDEKLKGKLKGRGEKDRGKKFDARKAVLLLNPRPEPRYYVFEIAP